MAKKPCVYCATKIEETASVCPTCKYHQARWRNNLLFVAGLGGIAAFVASAITFVIDRSTEIYKNIHWNDTVKIVDFRTGISTDSKPRFSAVIFNNGDGAVFVSNIIVYWGNGNIQYRVNKLIQPNDFSVVDNPDLSAGNYQNVEANATGIPSADIVQNAWFRVVDRNGKPSCFLAVVHTKDSADLDRMDSYYRAQKQRLITASVDSYVEYLSSHSKKKVRVKFPAVTVFARSSDSECQNLKSD